MNIHFHIILYIALFNTLTCNLTLNCAAAIQPSEDEESAILKQKKAQLFPELLKAIEQDDSTQVERLIKEGADVNHHTFVFYPIIEAAIYGNKDIVKLLIDAGADPTVETRGGRRALLGAAGQGHANIIKLLFLAGADINTINRRNETALIVAAKKGHIDTVKLLLALGANLDNADIDGNSATDYARERAFDEFQEGEFEDIVKILEAEPTRRAAAVKSWNDRASEIAKLLDQRLGIKPLKDIVLDYEAKPVEKFEDLPLDYRLEGLGIK